MPTYSYRCQSCGDFDVIASMSERPDSAPCPECGRQRPRLFRAPSLRTTSSALGAAFEQAGRSAEAPQVVHSIPQAAPAPRRPGAPVPVSARPGHYPALPRS